jgi:hypothetical protein
MPSAMTANGKQNSRSDKKVRFMACAVQTEPRVPDLQQIPSEFRE